MAGLLRGWHLSAVQRSSPNFRHFSEASLIHLTVIGSSNLGWKPCEDTLLRYPLEHRSVKARRTHAISSLKTEVCGVLVVGRDLGWRRILMTGFKQWKISPLFKVWSVQGFLITNEGGFCNLSLFTRCSSGFLHILSGVRLVIIAQPSSSTLTQRQNILPCLNCWGFSGSSNSTGTSFGTQSPRAQCFYRDWETRQGPPAGQQHPHPLDEVHTWLQDVTWSHTDLGCAFPQGSTLRRQGRFP